MYLCKMCEWDWKCGKISWQHDVTWSLSSRSILSSIPLLSLLVNPPHFFCHSHFELVPQTHTLQGVPPHLSAVNKGPGMASSGSMTMAQSGHQPVCCCKSKKIKSRTSQVDWFSFWETSHFLLRVTQVNTTSFQWVSVDTRLVFTSNCSNQVFSQ